MNGKRKSKALTSIFRTKYSKRRLELHLTNYTWEKLDHIASINHTTPKDSVTKEDVIRYILEESLETYERKGYFDAEE